MAKNLDTYLQLMSDVVTGLQDSFSKLQSNDQNAVNDIKAKTKDLKEIMNDLQQSQDFQSPLFSQINQTIEALESSLSEI